MAETEADTCRKFVVPKLREAGWDDAPHAINEQRTFTDGRIVFAGGKARRGRQKRAAEDLQQARDYAETLGLKFAYATNGVEIIEIDYTTGFVVSMERACRLDRYADPDISPWMMNR